MGGNWEVVGGNTTGGILVREGRSTDTKQAFPRLSTGAIVEELELIDGRLHYRVLSGTGPPTGWVSLKLKEQDLLVKTDKGAENAIGQTWGNAFDFDDLPDVVATKVPNAQERLNPPEVFAMIKARCDKELARDPIPWTLITVDTVVNNHSNVKPGMLYGMDFPWNEQSLAEFGPQWLTKAFHHVGSMREDNKVTKINIEQKIKVTTGNNGGKFLFDVEYEKPDPNLHMKLFAKIPFALEGRTRSDRLSSSVNKQPSELYEINAYRLLEATLPMKTPRFYFGDISNETSNWIIISERIAFHDFAGQNYGPPQDRPPALPAFEIEGPYDKCIDHNIRGDPAEYYMLLTKVGAKMAALSKLGYNGSPEVLRQSFGTTPDPKDVTKWGMNPGASSGQPANQLKMLLKSAVTFMSTTGKVVFPDFCQTDAFAKKFTDTMLKSAAYGAELGYWMHMNEDYIALGHGNMNVDNAYFWRDGDGKLDCGIFDWGGVSSASCGTKLWWWFYCMDYDVFAKNIKKFIDCYIDSYQEYGGPRLDAKELYDMVIIAGIQQMAGLVSAVPQIIKMCPKKEWDTIKDRYDPRIGSNIDDKSTIRLYLHCMNTIVRLIEWHDGDKILDRFIKDVYETRLKQTPKTAEMIGLP